LEAANEALRSGRWGLGPFNTRAAQRFSAVFGIKHVVLTANGSVPLTLAVKALGIGEGDEVLVPATTFQATAGAMYDARVVPTPIDCVPANLTIDPVAVRDHLERCVAEGRPLPRAVIAVALYSQLPDLRALRAICDDYGLKLIFDFAHGPYAEIDWQAATRFAHIVTYSFQQSKSLSLGEGGAIGTDDDELAPVIAMLVSCGYLPWGLLKAQIQDGLVLRRSVTGGFELPTSFRSQQSVNFRLAEVQAAQLYARLATFMDTFDRAVDNIAALQEVVGRFAGIVAPFDAVPDARGPFYKWGFRVNEEWLPGDVARWALRGQTGHEAIFCYPALTLADQRNPLVPEALRGLVADEYLKAITQPHDVPNAELAIRTAVMLEWAFVVRDDPATELERTLRVLQRDTRLILDRA
jgi:dTDP-4-amino-4,6-dideoxygalactose transaminase